MLRSCARFSSSQQKSAVDVENWTLNKEVVARHQEVQTKWIELSERFQKLAAENNFADQLTAVDEGFELFAQVGADDSPVHCPVMLHMTKAQAHFNLKNFGAALESATSAKEYFVSRGWKDHHPQQQQQQSSSSSSGGGATSAADEARVREIIEFIGFVHLERGSFNEALAIFNSMLEWVAVGSRKALPMVQVAAVNMKRTLQTGKGRALYGLAKQQGGGSDAVDNNNGSDKRQLLDEALDLIVESLSAHVDSSDVVSARMALDTATLCYCALGELDRAAEACDKLESWCARHDDKEGLALASSRRQEIASLRGQKK